VPYAFALYALCLLVGVATPVELLGGLYRIRDGPTHLQQTAVLHCCITTHTCTVGHKYVKYLPRTMYGAFNGHEALACNSCVKLATYSSSVGPIFVCF